MPSIEREETVSTSDYQKFENKRWDGRVQTVVFRHRAALDLLKESTARTYLDVGCGDGVFEEYMQHKEPLMKGAGIDLSHMAIDSARKKVPEADFIIADILTQGIPAADLTYDAVVALDVLEHTFAPQNLLSEMKRVSKKHLIIGVPNFSSLPARLQTIFGRVPENNRPKKGHVYWFNYPVLMNLMKANNLRILSLRTNFQAERVPVIGSIMRILTNLFPGLFALSFVILVEKVVVEEKNT